MFSHDSEKIDIWTFLVMSAKLPLDKKFMSDDSGIFGPNHQT